MVKMAGIREKFASDHDTGPFPPTLPEMVKSTIKPGQTFPSAIRMLTPDPVPPIPKREIRAGRPRRILFGGGLILVTALLSGSNAPIRHDYEVQSDSPPQLRPYRFPETKPPQGEDVIKEYLHELIPPYIPLPDSGDIYQES